MPAPKTIAAASGSCQMLNSAEAVVLPTPSEPPISEIAPIRSCSDGNARRNRAMLVSGPVGTSVTGRLDETNERRRELDRGLRPRGSNAGSGRSAPSSPLSPWKVCWMSGSRNSGRSAPAATGTSVRPSRVRTRRAFRVVSASPAFPATVVTASTSSCGCGTGEQDRERIVVARVAVEDHRARRAGGRSPRQRRERRGPLRVERDHRLKPPLRARTAGRRRPAGCSARRLRPGSRS